MDWTAIPRIDLALAGGLAAAAASAVITRHRGGRFRALPGWLGFWIVFSGILILLSRANRWVSFALVAFMMFAALRTYFFMAPVRPRDRIAILAAYLAIPLSLYPGFTRSSETFLAVVPIIVFLLFPVLAAVGKVQAGLFDSMGRILLGVLLFVYCAAHLGLLAQRPGLLELFGLLVLAAELPQRLSGRYRSGSGSLKPTLGAITGALLAVAAGWWAGPWVGLVSEDAGRAGLLVAIAVTLGALVGEAVFRDLEVGPGGRVGRGAFLDRAIPAIYAAPVFFHYLNHFA